MLPAATRRTSRSTRCIGDSFARAPGGAIVCEGADAGFCENVGDEGGTSGMRVAGAAAPRTPDVVAAAEASPPWMTRTTCPSSMISPGATGTGAPGGRHPTGDARAVLAARVLDLVNAAEVQDGVLARDRRVVDAHVA